MATNSAVGEADALAKWMVVASVVTLGLCTTIVPPYGRYSRSVIFGIRFPLLNAKLGWCLMECPNVFMPLWFLLYRADEVKACSQSLPNLALLFMFVLHYVNRHGGWWMYISHDITPQPSLNDHHSIPQGTPADGASGEVCPSSAMR